MLRGRSALRIAAVVVLLAVAVTLPTWRAASSQVDYESRVSDLETRVTLLEATVVAVSSDVTTASSEVAETHTMTGSLTLVGLSGEDFSIDSAGNCYGKGGFRDIQVGASVVVKSGSGDIIAQGRLEDDPKSRSGQCTFVFTVKVPQSDFYEVFAGGLQRGGPLYSFDEMEASGWHVDLSIGGS